MLATAAAAVVILRSPKPDTAAPPLQATPVFQPAIQPPESSQPTVSPSSYWRPGRGLTWQWQLSGNIDDSVPADVYDIDYQNTVDTVRRLHAQVVDGSHPHVICYVDIGGAEPYRPDYQSLVRAGIVGKHFDGWDESFVDVRKLDRLMPILQKRFDSCKGAGYDGVETDLDDMYQSNTGFPLTMADFERLDRRVADYLHSIGLAWFLKNGLNADSFLIDMEPLAQGTVNEECWDGDCAPLNVFIRHNKPVFNAQYGAQGDICSRATPFGMATIGKDQGLDAAIKWRCPVSKSLQPPTHPSTRPARILTGRLFILVIISVLCYNVSNRISDSIQIGQAILNLINWLRLSSVALLVDPVPPEGDADYSMGAWQEYARKIANIHLMRVQCALVWSLAIETCFGITFIIGGGSGMIYTQPLLLVAIAGAIYYTQRRIARNDDIWIYSTATEQMRDDALV